MATLITVRARAGLLGLAAVVAVGASAGPAGAISEPLDYSCTYVLPGVNGEGSATATFDSAIGEGLVVDVGDEVPLDPVTGSVTVTSGFVDALRAAGVTEISGGGETFIIVPETDFGSFGELSFDTTPVPETGALTVQIEGRSEPVEATDPGTNTIVLTSFSLIVGPPVDNEEDLTALFCDLPEGSEAGIDSFEAVAVATPTQTVTTTATATATPQRPVVVQTDFAEPPRRGPLPVLVGIGFASSIGAAFFARRRGLHGAARRH